ncbi:MAG: hypothetical protein EOP07_09970 [Proteobacteria bacterium]|nr:MAG: hypothetical protein EOP07_09970 [Pseudomonadota bacterium]
MKTNLTATMLVLAGLLPLSCGKAQTDSSLLSHSAPLAIDSLEASSLRSFRSASQLFNFAHLVTVQPALAKLLPYVGPGEAYLYFGEKDKFRVETNLTVDANGGLTDTGSRYISSDYYLDGYIFGRQLTDGALIDMQARANFNSMKLTGYVRFLGDDKYNGEIKVGIDKTFIRDLEYDKTIYGVPMLGVNVNATLGGELGMRAAPGLRADQAISASFEPSIKLQGAATISLKALKFLSASAEGTVEILDLKLSSGAALGVIPSSNFVYANMGMDGATISALDGKIDLYASAADIGGALSLPSGVSNLLWSLVGIKPSSLTWKHTLWDPEPAYVTTLKRFGNSFITFYKAPTAATCGGVITAVQENLKGRLAALEAEQTDDEYLSIIVSSNILGMNEVIGKASTYCKDLATGFPNEVVIPSGVRTDHSEPATVVTAPKVDDENDSIWGNGTIDPW